MLALCSNTCATARDGRCDDGGALLLERRLFPVDALPLASLTSEHRITCDLGTDCDDCGSREVRTPATLAEAMPSADAAHAAGAAGISTNPSPVAYLRGRGIEVRAAWTRTQPPFIMAYTDPTRDIDVSGGMASGRLVEATSTRYFGALCRRCCADGGLVLDVGANFGWYALYAATLGCRVVAWEPVPAFRAMLQLGAALNNVSHRVHIRDAALGDAPAANVTLRVPTSGLWGAASVGGLNVLRGSNEARGGTYMATTTAEALDDLVTEQARDSAERNPLDLRRHLGTISARSRRDLGAIS